MKSGPAKLDLDKNLTFQRREWQVQRVGWWILTAFVVAAALGLFGKGPLSHARTGEPGSPLWIEYDRFVRVGTTSRVLIHSTAAAGSLHLRVNREFFEANRVEHFTPEPASIHFGASEVDLRFDNQAGGAVTVILDVEPLQSGRLPASITSSNGGSASFRQFAYF
jgi:hypothetical protein